MKLPCPLLCLVVSPVRLGGPGLAGRHLQRLGSPLSRRLLIAQRERERGRDGGELHAAPAGVGHSDGAVLGATHRCATEDSCGVEKHLTEVSPLQAHPAEVGPGQLRLAEVGPLSRPL
jgi:hypothetical protein